MLIIDKPSLVTDPPDLPPYLKKRGKGDPGKRVIIIPDIIQLKRNNTHEIKDGKNNWITLIHHWMNRVTTVGEGSMLDPATDQTWEGAHSSSRTYRQWLETYDLSEQEGIPPHIQFCGAIKAGAADPTFYPRWKEWAKEYFV